MSLDGLIGNENFTSKLSIDNFELLQMTCTTGNRCLRSKSVKLLWINPQIYIETPLTLWESKDFRLALKSTEMKTSNARILHVQRSIDPHLQEATILPNGYFAEASRWVPVSVWESENFRFFCQRK